MMRCARDEAASPKYAHVERERRWLVDSALPPGLDGLPFVRIKDRYLTGTRLRLRRMTDSLTGEQALKLTKKYEADDPLARPIVTAYLSEREYELLLGHEASTLTKRRYPVREGEALFSVDRFEGRLSGLVLAEIEWPEADGLVALPAPGWAVKEVSADPRYQGGALAVHGIPETMTWPAS